MKKNLLYTILLMCGAVSMNAQILFQQDFESGLGDMTAIDNDGLTADANVAGFGSNWSVQPPGTFNGINSSIVVSNSWFVPAGSADDWLITPAIEINGGAALTWEAIALDPNFRDSYRIMVSTDGPEISAFTTELLDVPAELGGEWATRNVDLSAYDGQTIWIAFHNYSVDKFLLVLDNIQVRIPLGRDALVDNLGVVNSNFVNTMNVFTALEGQHTFSASITNYGSDLIENVEVSYSINGMPTTETVDVNIASGETYEYTSNFEGTPGSTLFNFAVTAINGMSDEDESNNSGEQTVMFLPPVPDFVVNDSKGNQVNMHSLLAEGKSVILDFMASWCGPCATSTPALNNYYVENGAGEEDLTVLAVTVERNDSDATMNTGAVAGWGATYPKIAFNDVNELYWIHFNRNHGLLTEDQQGGIPYFLMLCPNTGNPAYSTPVATQVGFGGGTFNGVFDGPLNECRANLTDVEEIDIISGINAFPNPNNTGNLTVEFGLDENATLTLNMVNLQGQVVKAMGTRNYASGNNTELVDISELSAGMYFLQMTKDGQVSNVKISVVK